MKFSISFDHRDRKTLHEHWDKIMDSEKWSEGEFTRQFEEMWAESTGLHAVSFSSWWGAARAALDYARVAGRKVMVPSNTFMATPLSVKHSRGDVVFYDCNREDLCGSFEDFRARAIHEKPKAAYLVHIGGHIAFEVERFRDFCLQHEIFLIEDCAHAHGAEWNGKKPGAWGDVGIYSFYATKTLPTGEGGMLVTKHKDLAEFARSYRNYGKFDYKVEGGNYRLSEFTAALGVVQTRRLPEIVAWKHEYARKLDQEFQNRVRFPEGMTSGYYKYIVFDQIDKSTGKVYDEPCHEIMRDPVHLPHTEWVKKNHWCVPIYYDGRRA